MQDIRHQAEKALSLGARVASFTADGRKYWAKSVQERGILLRLQKGSARSLFDNEIACFKSFARLGAPVPELVLETEDYFVSGDIGTPLDSNELLKTASRAGVLKDAIVMIAKMHNLGLAHGGLHLRNMCIDADKAPKLGFIDLEKAVAIDARIEAQAYDIVVFVWSMLSIDQTATADLSLAKSAYLAVGSKEVWQAAAAWANQKNWLRYAVRPLLWHESRFRQHKPTKRYQAVSATLDFLQP